MLILLLGIGFAAITISLSLTGNIQLSKDEADFDVKFTKAVLGENDISDTAIIEGGTKISYSTGVLRQVGETSVLDFDITNNSSLYNADVSLSCTTTGHSDYLDVAADINGSTTAIIKAKKTKKGKITVTIKQTTLEDISESFTCTISASARERNVTIADEPTTFVKAYTYNQTDGADNYCVTGNEITCVPTDCYKTKEVGSCPSGTIIKYMVNEDTEKTFHVMYDDENTITMQSQKNTVSSIAWMTYEDYVAVGGIPGEYRTDGNHNGNNNKGPVTVLNAIEAATADWTNVNEQTYKLGETEIFGSVYTGCSAYDNCNATTYILATRTGRARIISLQEAVGIGCTKSSGSCPKWMINYLYGVSGAINEGYNSAYLTLTANSSDSYYRIWGVEGYLYEYIDTRSTSYAARAVVQVNKE